MSKITNWKITFAYDEENTREDTNARIADVLSVFRDYRFEGNSVETGDLDLAFRIRLDFDEVIESIEAV